MPSLFKAFGAVLCLIFALCFAVPSARADSEYAISFTGAGAPTVVGSNLLDFNSTLMEFTTPSFTIDFGGSDIAMTLSQPGASPTDTFTWSAFGVGLDIADISRGTTLYSGTVPFQSDNPNGSVTFTAVQATPEPSYAGWGIIFSGLTAYEYPSRCKIISEVQPFVPFDCSFIRFHSTLASSNCR
jgi:hypothetical protein